MLTDEEKSDFLELLNGLRPTVAWPHWRAEHRVEPRVRCRELLLDLHVAQLSAFGAGCEPSFLKTHFWE